MALFNLGIVDAPPEKTNAPAKVEARILGGFKSRILIVGGSQPNVERSRSIFSDGYNSFWSLQGMAGLNVDFAQEFAFTYSKVNGEYCTDFLLETTKKLKPLAIILMGTDAINAVIMPRLVGRITGTAASEFYGRCIPDRYFGTWLCPIPFPTEAANLYKNGFGDNYYMKKMYEWLLAAVDVRGKPFPVISDDIHVTCDPDEAASWIRAAIAECRQNPVMAIDYETTGLKPHRDGHHIVSASLAWHGPKGYRAIGFKWNPDSENLISAWHELYKHGTHVRLVAHKADFETCWTHFRAGLHSGRTDWPTNWDWDTCIGAHIINNVQKVGLKLHTYVELGILGYDDGADPYLKGIKTELDTYGTNSFNGLCDDQKVPHGMIANYCAQDALYTLMLRDIQVKRITDPKEMEALKLFMDGMVALAKIQSSGLPIDFNRVDPIMADLDRKKSEVLHRALSRPESIKYVESTGTLLNIGSNPQLQTLFYDILKLEPPKGGDSKDVDEVTLESLGLDLCKDILEYRRYGKIADFLKGYRRESCWDQFENSYLIRPFFNLSAGASGDGGGPRTYRSSADSPNFQNIPKNDKEMKHLLRSLFVAPPGYLFVEADYKSLEAMISADYHLDPKMIEYLTKAGTDMHRDTAADMFLKKPEDVTKDERKCIKGGYVFASFYGSNYKSCATRMWNYIMPPSCKNYLASKGIDNYEKFEEHVQKVDYIFWKERFKVYDAWRLQEWRKYQTNGMLRTHIGFHIQGPMTKMQCSNACIQGTGFHVMLTALIWDIEDMERAKCKSKLIGQIHDAAIFLVKEEELPFIKEMVIRNHIVRVMDKYKWIKVPLEVDADMSEVGGTWAEMNKSEAWKA